ncbi:MULTISPECIES: GNAT family N-acetyltransferase [unclassified Pseudofrankia]|uniref:GNAT family N-acetyltransferase n=1 Tax=unclassified Pseudofrankia TaxID=2994372 RepID=UPI0008D921B6|nr:MULTISPECIES: GNAT family N-acetyltransferase [unclassified Pseudofrankia]MDT3443343.1 GNAT family N-acetyltransferase [Pseudofrankia sp. BMG5.37]OHV65329.1 acetyltransferase [Pseudofrankia sp. BMG5.36]
MTAPASTASASFTVPTVTTDRLLLRAWHPDDIAPYSAMNADEETMRHNGGTFDTAGTWRLVSHLIGMWALRGYGMWAVELRATGEFIGRAGLYAAFEWPAVEAAWSIRRDLWGQGLATEAAAAAIAWGWSTLPDDHFISIIDPANIASQRVAEKVGFTVTGHGSVGPWKDQILYRLDRSPPG